MSSDTMIVAAIEIPSTSPIFLTVVAPHVLLGLACVISGAGANGVKLPRSNELVLGTVLANSHRIF